MFWRHLTPSSELRVSQQRFIKIQKTKQEVSRGTAKQICHHRSCNKKNHVIDWDLVKVLGHESDRKTRWIKEAFAIRKSKDKCMNRDPGSYFLSAKL